MVDTNVPGEPTPQPRPYDAGGHDPELTDILDTGTFLGAEAAPGGRRGRWVIGGVAGVLGVGAIGAGAWAFAALSGGGSQPADVLPGDAVAYLRVDLDPAANQKIDALAIMHKFPELAERMGGSDDLFESLWNLVAEDSPELAAYDFDEEIEPVLGERAGVALLNTAGMATEAPDFVVAIQVEDEQAARDLFEDVTEGGLEAGLGFRDGYALLAPTQELVDAAVAADDTLADNAGFREANEALGEPGIASAWLDGDTLGELMQQEALPGFEDLEAMTGTSGQTAIALRFDGDVVELAGVMTGAEPPARFGEGSGPGIADLPSSTVAALQLDGMGEGLAELWESDYFAQLDEGGELSAFEAELADLGIDLPADLETIFGERIVAALDAEGLASGEFTVGGLVTTDVDRANTILDTLLENGVIPPEADLPRGDDGERVAVATTPDYVDRLLAGGDLGDQEMFRSVLPEDDPQFALYVDVAGLLDGMGSDTGLSVDDAEIADVFRAIGIASSQTDDGATFTLRLATSS